MNGDGRPVIKRLLMKLGKKGNQIMRMEAKNVFIITRLLAINGNGMTTNVVTEFEHFVSIQEVKKNKNSLDFNSKL